MKSFLPKKEDIQRKWYVVDASNEVLGRLASRVALILRGKNKPMFSPMVDTGDYVVIINAAKVRLTGNKLTQKFYYRHSGYPGGLTERRYDSLMREKPEFVVSKAVRGMLPKNKLGDRMLTRLKVFEGAEHGHAAQQPELIKVTK